MTDLEQIEGITRPEVGILHAAQVFSIERLWTWVYAQGFEAVGQASNLPIGDLQQLLPVWVGKPRPTSIGVSPPIESLNDLWTRLGTSGEQRIAALLVPGANIANLRIRLGQSATRGALLREGERGVHLANPVAGCTTLLALREHVEAIGVGRVATAAGVTPALVRAWLTTPAALAARTTEEEQSAAVDDVVYGMGWLGGNLREAGITTVGELRYRLQSDGLAYTARELGVEPGVLAELAVRRGVTEARHVGESFFGRHRDIRTAIQLAGAVLVVALVATAVIALPPIQAALFGEPVVSALIDLEPGRVLRAQDLAVAHQRFVDLPFATSAELDGLVLKQAVARGNPVRQADVLRYQVVAKQDVASGEVITQMAVGLSWSTYDARAVIRLEDAIGWRARQALKSDSVITAEAIDPHLPNQTFVSQVVVKSDVRLPRLHVIRPEEVMPRDTPRAAAAFSSTDQVVGRIALTPLAQGSVVLKDQLSQRPLGQTEIDSLQNRLLISLPLALLPDQKGLVTPNAFSLQLAMRDATQPPPPETAVKIDAFVLTIDAQTDGSLLAIAAVKPESVAQLRPQLAMLQIVGAICQEAHGMPTCAPANTS